MTGAEPIIISLDLAAGPVRAFEAFAQQFASWWPVVTHSLSRDVTTVCRLTPAPGGAVEERGPDGSWHRWGTVEAVDPGRRLRFSWHPGRDAGSAQWIEVLFEAHGPGSRVTLTHGGWESLGEIAPILRREYAAGWQSVLGGNYAEFVARPG
jgi:uncharacterized protein YndB with AHSA1/START domain